MAQEVKFSVSKHSVVHNINVQNSSGSNYARNVIITDSNNNKIGIWSRYKSIFHHTSHAIPLVGFSTKIHKSATQLTDGYIYTQRDYFSKINIPYEYAHWIDHNTRQIVQPQHYFTYIFPIWYIPDDSKNRILTSLQSGGGSVNNYIKWPNYKDLNGVRCYAYTKLLSNSNLTGGDRPNNKQFPYRGPLRYARENIEHVSSFTKSFRFCGDNVPTDTTGRNIDFVDFTTDMDKYTLHGDPVTLQVTSSDWANLRLKIDYLNQYGAQVVSTISSNTALTIMVGSIVYATPCLVSNYNNDRQFHAVASVSNNSISSPMSFSDNPTIYCGLLEGNVNLGNNYPNSFRIVANCTINLSKSNNTVTRLVQAFTANNNSWATAKAIAENNHFTSLYYGKCSDSSLPPTTDYNDIYYTSWDWWPSSGNSLCSKVHAVPNGYQAETIDQSTTSDTCIIRFDYSANGFITSYNLWQNTGARRSFNTYFYFI